MLRSALVLITFVLCVSGEPGRDPAGDAALQHYLDASSSQQGKLRNLAMEVDIDASLPRLKKEGHLRGLRHVTRLGGIVYRAIKMDGDNTVKKDVIARYLQAEKEAAEKGGSSLGITPENYKFEYFGLRGTGDWRLHLFHVEPRKKRQGLFEGWLWVESKTGLPVREQGFLVKNPSIFLRKVSFVRDYEIRDGVAYPTLLQSSIETRLVGMAEMTVRYSNVSPVEDSSEAETSTAENSR